MISKHISEAPRVIPIGKQMADYFEQMESEGIIFVKTSGCNLITLDYIEGYTFDIPTESIVTYYEKHLQDINVSQIVVLDTKTKTIIGLTSVVGNRLWLPIISKAYHDLSIGLVLMVLAIYESKETLTIAIPYYDMTAGALVSLCAFLNKFGFKALPEPMHAETKTYLFSKSNEVIVFIRRPVCSIFSRLELKKFELEFEQIFKGI